MRSYGQFSEEEHDTEAESVIRVYFDIMDRVVYRSQPATPVPEGEQISDISHVSDYMANQR